mgnify:CR=1 FL=1
MSYQVRIVAGSDGKMYIGAAAIAALERSGGTVEDEAYVYGSQLPHRCVVKPAGRTHEITTPREARHFGWLITCPPHGAIHSREV